MNQKRYILYGTLIAVPMAVLGGWSIVEGEPVVFMSAVTVSAILFHFLRTRVTEVIEDERTCKISEKASLRTVQVVGLPALITGQVLLCLSKVGYEDLGQIGEPLAFFAIVLFVVYLIFYGYYTRKYGSGAHEE